MLEGEKNGVKVVNGGQNLPLLVGIGLTDLPKIGSGITKFNSSNNLDFEFIVCSVFVTKIQIIQKSSLVRILVIQSSDKIAKFGTWTLDRAISLNCKEFMSCTCIILLSCPARVHASSTS